eukprot:3373457-Lingulodinium_polyedra.AAC.1
MRTPKHEWAEAKAQVALAGMHAETWEIVATVPRSLHSARASACLQTMHRKAPPECTSAKWDPRAGN